MRVGGSPPVWLRGGSHQRKLRVVAAESASWKLQQKPVKAGSCSTSRAEGSESDVSRQLIVGLASGGVVRCKPDGSPLVVRKRVAPDASREYATGRAERSPRRSEPGKSAAGRAGRGAVGASRRFLKPAQPEEGAAAQAAGSPLGELEDATAGCTTRSSRLRRQRLRSLAFSILGLFPNCPVRPAPAAFAAAAPSSFDLDQELALRPFSYPLRTGSPARSAISRAIFFGR
jgi:hypothetical protein